MSETLTIERPVGVKWSPGRFARAIVEGKTLAEAAQYAGSPALTEASRQVIGSRWLRSPRVMALLSEIKPLAVYGIQRGVKRLIGVLEGEKGYTGDYPTRFDEIQAFDRLARLEGLYVTKIQVEHLKPVEFRGFGLAPVIEGTLVDGDGASIAGLTDSALEAQVNALNAELARRKVGVPVLPASTDSPRIESLTIRAMVEAPGPLTYP